VGETAFRDIATDTRAPHQGTVMAIVGIPVHPLRLRRHQGVWCGWPEGELMAVTAQSDPWDDLAHSAVVAAGFAAMGLFDEINFTIHGAVTVFQGSCETAAGKLKRSPSAIQQTVLDGVEADLRRNEATVLRLADRLVRRLSLGGRELAELLAGVAAAPI
jgi:hypothetical protein